MSNIHSSKQWELKNYYLVVDTEVSKQTLYKYWNNIDIYFVDNCYCEFIKDVCEGNWKLLCIFIAIVILNKTLCLSMKRWISFPSWGEPIKPNVRIIHGKHLFFYTLQFRYCFKDMTDVYLFSSDFLLSNEQFCQDIP